MLMSAHKAQRMALALIFLRAIPQRCRWISQSCCTSNRLWNLGFIYECRNQRAVRAVDAHTFIKQAKKSLNRCLQKVDCSWFLGQERSADGGIHATRDHNNIRTVLWNMKKTT
jgi:hypothetical protein